jgi:hypothetical protein
MKEEGLGKVKELKEELLDAAEEGVKELIKVLKEGIVLDDDAAKDLSADRLKNAAQAKKVAFDDGLYILQRVAEERELDRVDGGTGTKTGGGFAERRAT